MAKWNNLKKKKQYQCVECYSKIDYAPSKKDDTFTYRCKKCRKECLFVPMEDEE